MVVIILVGLGFGVGLAATVWGLFPPPLTLRAALARLSGEHVTAPTDVLTEGVGAARRLCGHLLEVNVRKVPRLADIVLPDLAITGTPTETFAVKVAGYAIGLAMLGPVLWAASGAVGVHLGVELPCTRGVGSRCSRRGHAVLRPPPGSRAPTPALLPLALHLRIAGVDGHGRSHGVVECPRVASTVSSTDWAMAEIAQSLLWAQAYRKQPWEGLERLAVRFDIPDLTDLARSMSQAGDGARIRDSLEAKAHSLRLKETSALEDSAQAVTQKMLLPGVLLMAGYGLLIFYPALASFTGAHL